MNLVNTPQVKKPISIRSDQAVAIVKAELENAGADYLRLIREKRVGGVDGHCLKFYGTNVTGSDLPKFMIAILDKLAPLGLTASYRYDKYTNRASVRVYCFKK